MVLHENLQQLSEKPKTFELGDYFLAELARYNNNFLNFLLKITTDILFYEKVPGSFLVDKMDFVEEKICGSMILEGLNSDFRNSLGFALLSGTPKKLKSQVLAELDRSETDRSWEIMYEFFLFHTGKISAFSEKQLRSFIKKIVIDKTAAEAKKVMQERGKISDQLHNFIEVPKDTQEPFSFDTIDHYSFNKYRDLLPEELQASVLTDLGVFGLDSPTANLCIRDSLLHRTDEFGFEDFLKVRRTKKITDSLLNIQESQDQPLTANCSVSVDQELNDNENLVISFLNADHVKEKGDLATRSFEQFALAYSNLVKKSTSLDELEENEDLEIEDILLTMRNLFSNLNGNDYILENRLVDAHYDCKDPHVREVFDWILENGEGTILPQLVQKFYNNTSVSVSITRSTPCIIRFRYRESLIEFSFSEDLNGFESLEVGFFKVINSKLEDTPWKKEKYDSTAKSSKDKDSNKILIPETITSISKDVNSGNLVIEDKEHPEFTFIKNKVLRILDHQDQIEFDGLTLDLFAQMVTNTVFHLSTILGDRKIGYSRIHKVLEFFLNNFALKENRLPNSSESIERRGSRSINLEFADNAPELEPPSPQQLLTFFNDTNAVLSEAGMEDLSLNNAVALGELSVDYGNFFKSSRGRQLRFYEHLLSDDVSIDAIRGEIDFLNKIGIDQFNEELRLNSFFNAFRRTDSIKQQLQLLESIGIERIAAAIDTKSHKLKMDLDSFRIFFKKVLRDKFNFFLESIENIKEAGGSTVDSNFNEFSVFVTLLTIYEAAFKDYEIGFHITDTFPQDETKELILEMGKLASAKAGSYRNSRTLYRTLLFRNGKEEFYGGEEEQIAKEATQDFDIYSKGHFYPIDIERYSRGVPAFFNISEKETKKYIEKLKLIHLFKHLYKSIKSPLDRETIFYLRQKSDFIDLLGSLLKKLHGKESLIILIRFLYSSTRFLANSGSVQQEIGNLLNSLNEIVKEGDSLGTNAYRRNLIAVLKELRVFDYVLKEEYQTKVTAFDYDETNRMRIARYIVEDNPKIHSFAKRYVALEVEAQKYSSQINSSDKVEELLEAFAEKGN